MVLQEAVMCQLGPEKNKQKHLRRAWGKTQLLELVIRRKPIYFGHAYQHQESGLMKLMFLGEKEVEDTHPWINNISNITSWIGCNTEQLFKLARDRGRWHEESFNAARAANIKYDDAVTD